MILLFLIICILVVPAVFGYVYDWNVTFGLSISVFSAVSLTHFLFQTIIAALERKRVSRYRPAPDSKRVGVQITGWKEDPELFQKCLESIKAQTTQPAYITFCSDGNEESDEYMIDIFCRVFPAFLLIRLGDEITEKSTLPIISPDVMTICITQPHKGKRAAMYSQTKLLLSLDVDYILYIDSDTIVDKRGISYLLSSAVATKAAAVTGDVCIHNLDNLLAFLVSLKYWFAFSLERSAQSYFGNVGCISGPFGLYTVEALRPIIDVWRQQKFMGKECTFGDDRHLTNLVLRNGGRTHYDWRAMCYTDTPSSYQRYITQQTRWSKSFIREYVLNFGWFHFRQLWLLYDLSFTTVYSLLLTAYIVILCVRMNYTHITLFITSVLGAMLVRAAYAFYFTRKTAFFVFPLYAYIYICFLIPVKLWAMVTVNVTSWGTGSRLVKTSKFVDMVPVYMWSMFLVGTTGVAFAKKISSGFGLVDIICTTVNALVTTASCVYYRCIRSRERAAAIQVETSLDYYQLL